MGALILHEDDGLIPRDVFVTPQLFERRKEILVPDYSITLKKPEDFAAMMPVAERDFEAWLEALEIGDGRAVSWFRTYVRRRRGLSFSSYDESFYVGSGTITGPAGVAAALLRSYGGGGGGAWRNSASTSGRGGGGGGFCQSSPTISAGATLGYAVGALGEAALSSGSNGTDGGATTTASGTGGFSGITHNAGGGGGGQPTTNGAAGTAAGGTVNTNGAASGASDGGACLGTGGGTGGLGAVYFESSPSTPGSSPGGGGGGGNNDALYGPPSSGGSGLFYVLWS